MSKEAKEKRYSNVDYFNWDDYCDYEENCKNYGKNCKNCLRNYDNHDEYEPKDSDVRDE